MISAHTLSPPDSQPPLSPMVAVVVLVASAAIGLLAASTQSFWIDEALTAVVAMADSPADAWAHAAKVGGTTIQMPLYLSYVFLWVKAFGESEWILRAANVPFFVLGQLAFLVILRRRPGLALSACLLAAVNPLLWSYLNEARPYVMQYGAACWLAAFVVLLATQPGDETLEARPPHVWAAMAATVVLCGASSLGFIWAGGFWAAIIYLWLHKGRVHFHRPPASLGAVAVTLLLLALLAAYYAWATLTFRDGFFDRPPGLINLAFVAYEVLGFNGLGPGRLQLRAEPVVSVLAALPSLIPLAAVFGLLALFTLLLLLRHRPERRVVLSVVLALLIPSAVIFAAAFLTNFRILARHFIPALPLFLLFAGWLIFQAWHQPRWLWRGVAALLPALWLASSLGTLLLARHAKDDYRTAAQVVRQATEQGREAWWVADAAAAYLYRVPLSFQREDQKVWVLAGPSWEALGGRTPPDLIVLSKPDIFDPLGAVRRYIEENRLQLVLQLQAFEVYARQP